ncbi:MAG TPA: DUF4937 domain-containing protein [Candidatus Krumholzibacteria bacterium]|nr:DUF4937 domain-containing protein [Candidatus Krumholzibacteria bacterium]
MSPPKHSQLILKWIRCTVEPSQSLAFDRAQRAWSQLHEVAGFLAQTGGWDSEHQNEAGILALWRGLEHYREFMERVHDRVLAASGQDRSYTRIRPGLFRLATSETHRARQLSERFTGAQSIQLTLRHDGGVHVLLLRDGAGSEEFIASPSPSEPKASSLVERVSHDSHLRVEPAWRIQCAD